MNVLDKFLKYVSIDTTSDSTKKTTPSTKNQRKLAQLLVQELKDLNIRDVYYDEKNCYVYAVLKGNEALPKIGFISHLDTSESAKGERIKPYFFTNYQGQDIILNDNKILRSADYPDLLNHIGKTLITTDGTTLLGADDKAGIAEIMMMLAYYCFNEEEHGDIYVCFTPDEEIGLGTLNFDKERFKPDFAYTVDGSSLGEFSYENFNAATATIKITGIPTHCGTAKDKMINAGRIATIFASLIPEEIPENTEGYEGFYHLQSITGDVSCAKMQYLIRAFDKNEFANRKKIIESIVEKLNEKYNNCIECEIKDSYYNMFEIIKAQTDLINTTKAALKKLNISCLTTPIRGGTDGTQISYMGIPCPNLGTGGHNFHSVYEYICIEDMEKTCELLIEIVREFARRKNMTLNKKNN